MKKIQAVFEIDEAVLMESVADTGVTTVEEAIQQELGWVRDSGMYVESWDHIDVSDSNDSAAKNVPALPTVEQIASIFVGNIVIVNNGNGKELFFGPSNHAVDSPYGKCPCEAVRLRSGRLTLCLEYDVARNACSKD